MPGIEGRWVLFLPLSEQGNECSFQVCHTWRGNHSYPFLSSIFIVLKVQLCDLAMNTGENVKKGRRGDNSHHAIWLLLNQLSSNQLSTVFEVLTHSVDALAHRMQMCLSSPSNYTKALPRPSAPPACASLVGSICCWVSLLDSQQVPFKVECSEWMCLRSWPFWFIFLLLAWSGVWSFQLRCFKSVWTQPIPSVLLLASCTLVPTSLSPTCCVTSTPESSPLSLGVYLCLLGIFMLISTVV